MILLPLICYVLLGYIFKFHPPTERNVGTVIEQRNPMANDRNWIKAQNNMASIL